MTTGWSIRERLIAWNLVSMAVVLLLFVALMTVMIRRHVHQRMDAELMEEAKELSEEIESQVLTAAFQNRFDRFYAEHGGFSFEVSRLDGTVLCGSPWLRAHRLPRPASIDDPTFRSLQDVTLADFGLHRLFSRIVQGPAGPMVIHVLTPCKQLEQELAAFFQMLLLGCAISMGVACLAGLLVTRRVLDPLTRMTHAAERISAENLKMSIAVDNPRDEIGRLATTLNRTFERLRSSLEQIRRFTSDAAHELRTPLTVMRTEAEVALRNSNEPEQFRRSLQTVLGQAHCLTKLIDQLLTLSRLDTVDRKLFFDEVYLEPLLYDVVNSLQPNAEKQRVSLLVGQIPACVVWGDDISLGRLFINLLENAIKYTLAEGTVTISGEIVGRTIKLQVTDTGIGIAPVHWSHIFDRFYRVDASRNGQSGGVGLGLAICRSIVELHDGTISVTSEPGRGTTFTVILPLMSTSESIRELEDVRRE